MLEIKNLKTEIKIMIEIVSEENKKKGVDILRKMLDGLTNGDMSFL